MRLMVMTCLLVVLSIAAVAPGPLARMAAAEPDSEIKKMVLDVLYQEEARLADQRYRVLFDAVSIDALRQLKADPHDSIALQAAWEEVQLSLPEKDQQQPTPVQPAKLERFLGFLEGRGRVEIPHWWENALREVRSRGRDHKVFCLSHVLAFQRGKSTGLRITTEEGVSLSKENGTIKLRVGKESLVMPRELIIEDRVLDRYDDLSVLISGQHWYVAMYDTVGCKYPLVCLENKTGKMLWQAVVWGTWWWESSGLHSQRVTLSKQDERVVVFGASNTGAHVEAFRASDGTNLFRVSTTLGTSLGPK
jgi:hypothetical protein